MPAAAPSRLAAALVHALTASGAACALLAMLDLISRDWTGMFAWLGAALVIDAIDGPLARAARVRFVLPRFSGDRLDLIIDYVTYVFIPAVALVEAGFLTGATGVGLAAAIVVSSLYHFSDLQSKTEDNCFVGFPAVWNLVALYVFALGLSPAVTEAIVLVGVVWTFVPTKWVHPVRVKAWRPVTLAMCAVWAAAAVWAVVAGFPAPAAAQWLLGLGAVYALGLCLWHGMARRSE